MLISFLKKSLVQAIGCIALFFAVFSVSELRAQPMQLAQQDSGQNEEEIISQRRALELVRAKFSGNVVSINEVSRRGGRYYRVRMDDSGNIFTVYVNAANGAITREQ